ncbi:MAG: hypothetical protein EOO52_00625 [Gammaproteobacteria bacterium]|nr:MAG: hypothetical protein EOO52_00625 [Gammaproteobacteria bacterium]
MKRSTIYFLTIFLAQYCYSNEWIAVGEQPTLTNTAALENHLWNYIGSNTKVAFQSKEKYRFQYKFINKSSVLINAICLPAIRNENELGVFPGATTEDLKVSFYQVKDGGSCFFNVRYNIKTRDFDSLYINGEA